VSPDLSERDIRTSLIVDSDEPATLELFHFRDCDVRYFAIPVTVPTGPEIPIAPTGTAQECILRNWEVDDGILWDFPPHRETIDQAVWCDPSQRWSDDR
jgi:hypothetical protein